MPKAKILRADFAELADHAPAFGQGLLLERYTTKRTRRGRAIHWRIDKAINLRGLSATPLLLARALALHMRQDADGVWYAIATRQEILRSAGLSSITTYQKNMPRVLEAFGIQVTRTGHALRFVWDSITPPHRAAEGDNAPQETAAPRDFSLNPFARRILSTGLFRPILTRAGLRGFTSLSLTLADHVAPSPRLTTLFRAAPWQWVAYIEARLDAGRPHPAEGAALDLAGITARAPLDAGRVDELRAAYEATPEEQTPMESTA